MVDYKVRADCQIEKLAEIYKKYLGNRPPTNYVEVGAFDGRNWSATQGLAELGWRGLLVEPQPDLAEACRRNYAALPEIQVAQVAVGDHNGETQLYLGGSNSTIEPGMVDLYNDLEFSRFSGLRHDRSITVPLMTLDALLMKYTWPNPIGVLVIDVEGAEMQVLRGFTILRYMPWLVIVETHEEYGDPRLSAKAREINSYMRQFGWGQVYTSHINSVYVTSSRL